ncbi:hypothetical protein PS15m_006306 [Mucor circinelloides]
MFSKSCHSLDSEKAFDDIGVDISKEKIAFSKTMYQKNDDNDQMFASALLGLYDVPRLQNNV